MTGKTYLNATINKDSYDVIVAGGGPAGFAAAISASRNGMNTLLVERNGCIGGTSTSGALPFWLGAMTGSIPFHKMIEKELAYKDLPRPRKAVGGIFIEAVERIKQADGGVGPCEVAQTDKYPGLDRLGCHDEFTFDIEIGKRVLEEMTSEAGVSILYYTNVIGTKVKDRSIKGIYTANKDGVLYTQAKTFIDCSGDADLVFQAGFAVTKSDRKTNAMSSLVAHIENIDPAKIEDYLNTCGDPWFRGICALAKKEKPNIDLPDELIIFPMVQEGVFMINGGTTFCGFDGTSANDLTKLVMLGRQRARILVEELFRPYIPGAQDCRLRLTAAYPGIRETRRIVAEYSLTEKDLLHGNDFYDVVALGGRHFDLSRGGKQPFLERDLSVKDGITKIPFRAMIPKDTTNIIAAGRCIDAQGQALGPVRIMSTCMALGEAAGIAAAISVKKTVSFRYVNADELRGTLKNQGAIVD